MNLKQRASALVRLASRVIPLAAVLPAVGHADEADARALLRCTCQASTFSSAMSTLR